MSIKETIFTTVGGKIGGKIWNTVVQAFEDWKEGRRQRLAMTIGVEGTMTVLPENEGVIQGIVHPRDQFEEPVILNGTFLADESFVEFADEILEYEEKAVLFLCIDEETGEVFFAEFDFSGYAMAIWPGVYSLYAFIIDPALDDILAIGYPDCGDLEDPNPIELVGSGHLAMDFVLFEQDEDDDFY